MSKNNPVARACKRAGIETPVEFESVTRSHVLVPKLATAALALVEPPRQPNGHFVKGSRRASRDRRIKRLAQTLARGPEAVAADVAALALEV